jgi:drug/metabolite transporter (DMT)-like permease
MIKPLLERSPVLWVNWWRLVGGLLSIAILAPLLPHRIRRLDRLFDRGVWKVMIPGSIVGTYVSLLLWLAGLKYAQASIAAALNQTATLWTFLLAVFLLKEPITWIRVAGLVVGLAGVAMVTFG